MRIQPLAMVVMAYLWIPPAAEVAADVVLSVVSTAPTRPHFVAAGTATTFVLSASNTTVQPATLAVAIQLVSGSAGDWQAVLSEADEMFRPVGIASNQVTVTIPAAQTVELIVQLSAGQALAEGAEGGARVSAWAQGTLQGTVELRARVRNRPKVYYVAIDGCGRGYLSLNRKGTTFDGTGERLMPRASAFAARSAHMTAATSVLPAVTDPNHAAALTGSWSGTLGIFSVLHHYVGQDPDGHSVMAKNSREMLRWGHDGRRIQSIFDVNKDPTSGGAPSTFNAIVTGKNWLGELFRDGVMDLVVHGKDYPDYVPPPQPYRLGDPPSDADPDQDRDGTNLGPWGIKHLVSTEAWLIGATPWNFPEDRWIAEATVRVIQAEDPDVLYVDLASADDAQHVFGAADRPEEWDARGTPGILWDDESMYNRNANRDPVLDVVHEADWDFGLIADALDARQALGRSFVILLSDHGLTTALDTSTPPLDPGKLLVNGGLTESDVERIANRGETAHIHLTDPTKSTAAEAILESYEVFDPVEQEMVKPFIVISRGEMDGGVDGVDRAATEDGVMGNREGALYSEWSIDEPNSDNAKVRWPDLFIFTRRHFRTKISTRLSSSGDGPRLDGVHGAPSSADVILVANGPGIRPGVYTAPASLVDIAPTLYHLLGVAAPGNVNGRVLEEILDR